MADELINNLALTVPTVAAEEPLEEAVEEDAAAADMPDDLEADPVAELYFDFITSHFNALPEPVRNYLNSSRVAADLREIYQESNLTADDREVAYAVVLKVFFGLVKTTDFANVLRTELGWPDSEADRCRRLTISLLGRIMLPAQGFLGDLSVLLVDFGSRVEDFPNEQIELRVMTYDEGAKEIAAAVELPFEAEDRTRLQHIIATRLHDVRDEMETKGILMRPRKVGGLELEDFAVEHIFAIMKEKAKLTKYVQYVDHMPVGRDALGPTEVMPATDQSVVVTPAGESVEPAAPMMPAEPVAVPAPAKPGITSAEIKAIYNGTDEERASLAKRISKFKEVTASDMTRERDAFYEILYPPDLGPVEPFFVVAAVLTMADDGALVKTLTDDLRFRELINKFLVDQQQQSAAFRFAEKPGDVEFMNILLQLVLRGFASLPDEAAARFGLRASRAMSRSGNPEYEGLVAFDSDLKAFRWLKPIDL